MSPIADSFDETFEDLLDRVSKIDIASDDATTAVRNLRTLSECRPQLLEDRKPDPEPVPTTFWGKLKAGAASVWDNETTRVLIKAGGGFAGVGLVTWATVHRDHVLEKQALAQSNQRLS